MDLSAFRSLAKEKALAAICLLILALMIVAAFWPFNPFPANRVTWLVGENGLRFSGSGILWGSRNFEFPGSNAASGVSLELWLEPSQDKYSTSLLSFSSAANPDQFRLRQSRDFLLVLQESFPSARHTALRALWVPHAFQARKRRFIAITSGTQGTTAYLDGIPSEHSALRITPKDFSGQLLVGCSPVTFDTWRGKLIGIAIFGSELTPAQVSKHYHAWQSEQPELIKSDEAVALYTFAERAGNTVHNQVPSQPDLLIPASFSIPYKPFLKPPWEDFYLNEAYLRDIFINVAGFVPFGFFFCLYFSSGRASEKTVIATIVLGAAFSLTIEVLQWYIPMRDSGTTDILTNTLGTAIGAALCRGGTLSFILNKLEPRTTQ